MSQKKYVTKKTILKAIATEPLIGGSFVLSADDERKDCSVCAVGAVLRRAGMKNSEIYDFGRVMVDSGPCANREESIPEVLKDGEFLHALSLKFEAQSDRTGYGKRTRNVLANFVKKHFPHRIKLDATL